MAKKVYSSFDEANAHEKRIAAAKVTEERLKQIVKKQIQDEQERKNEEIELAKWENRNSYLEERENLYETLSNAKLEQFWQDREKLDLEPDEIELLKNVIGQRKQIEHVQFQHPIVCGDCGMVGDNCTCHSA